MTDVHRITATDAATRQHRRVKQGLVASWIHEISARRGTVVPEEAVLSASAVEPEPSGR